MCSVTLNFADWLEAIFWRSFWHIFWHSFWHIFWYILLTYLLTFFLTYLLTFFLTSFWHIFWYILLTFFLTYLLTFFLTYLLTLFLTYLLTYLSTCFLTYLLTFFLTYQNQNLTSTASHKKPLCKLYIYLTPRSKSNIHDNFVPVNVIALSASDRLAKRQLSPKMQNACSSTRTHTTCIRPPCQTAVESKHAKGFKVPRLHLTACANHEARRLPLWFFHFFCVGGSAPHIICLPLVHSILPKRGRSTKDCSALLRSCSPSAFGTGLPSYATYHLFPSTTSSMINIKSPACVVLGGSMHTYMRSAPTGVNL